MFKGRAKWLILVYLGLIILLISIQPEENRWYDSFEADDRNPYGALVFYDLLEDIFVYGVSQLEEPFYNELDDFDEDINNEAYIVITNELYLDDLDRTALLDWVSLGNIAFISATRIDQTLLDTLNLSTKFAYWHGFEQNELTMHYIVDSLDDKSYAYDKVINLETFFTRYDSLQHPQVLSINSNNLDTLMVSVAFGKGTIFLHALPYAFSNYQMLKGDHAEAAATAISYIPYEYDVYWDSYYKPRRLSRSRPAMSTFFETKSFRWAFGLGATLLFLFMVFKLKRNQRMIPIVKPYENTSLELVRTLGDLYYESKDNKDLSLKMQKQFKEYVKEKYRIFDLKFEDENMNMIIAKSGQAKGLVATIFKYMKRIEPQSLDDQSLLILGQKLSTFYQRKQEKTSN